MRTLIAHAWLGRLGVPKRPRMALRVVPDCLVCAPGLKEAACFKPRTHACAHARTHTHACKQCTLTRTHGCAPTAPSPMALRSEAVPAGACTHRHRPRRVHSHVRGHRLQKTHCTTARTLLAGADATLWFRLADAAGHAGKPGLARYALEAGLARAPRSVTQLEHALEVGRAGCCAWLACFSRAQR